jgi:hypothetical protein
MRTYRKNIPVLDRAFESNEAYMAELYRRAEMGRPFSDFLN